MRKIHLTNPEPLKEAEYYLILEKEVDQQLKFEDYIAKKLIFIGDKGDTVYFCFDCIITFHPLAC